VPAVPRVSLFSALLLWAALTTVAGAQENAQPEPQGALPDAAFQMAFRKYTRAASAYAPFYSWDAHIGLAVTAYRWGAQDIEVTSIIQTIGTENLGRKVSVGATGYILGLEYERRFRAIRLSAGFRHLSSHLTRDLRDKEDEVRNQGGEVPTVADPSQYNIVHVDAAFTLSPLPFEPRVRVLVSPLNFRFNGHLVDARPVYAETEWPLWRGRDTALVVETQHELGSNAFDTYTLRIDLFAGSQSRRRLEALLSVSPGDEFHVSPIVGGVVDGVAIGFRVNFRT
jgi:hypothetical protein